MPTRNNDINFSVQVWINDRWEAWGLFSSLMEAKTYVKDIYIILNLNYRICVRNQ